MMKHLLLILFIAAMVCIACIQQQSKQNLSYNLFQITKGWGYDILIDNKIFIHQVNIPSIQNEMTFENSEQAKKAALQVIKKIAHHENPALTRSEIQILLR